MSSLSKISNFESFNCIRGRRSGIINRTNMKVFFVCKRDTFWKWKHNVLSLLFHGIFLGEKVSCLCHLFCFSPNTSLTCEEQLQSSSLWVWEWALWAQQCFDQTPWFNSPELNLVPVNFPLLAWSPPADYCEHVKAQQGLYFASANQSWKKEQMYFDFFAPSILCKITNKSCCNQSLV